MSLRRRSVFTLMATLALASAPATTQMDEYSIKAAYLYNFSKYVGWPEATAPSRAHFAICIVGDDPFGGRLDQTVAGKTSGDGRPLEVRRVKADDSNALRDCQIVFVSKSEKKRVAALLAATKDTAVMTVADFTPFAEEGGIANLRIDGTKVKVDLNMSAAMHANLKVSGKLQQVANLVP